MPRGSNKINEIGNVYGLWTVIELFGSDKRGRLRWLCKCVCGIKKDVDGTSLRIGQSTGCRSCSNKDLSDSHLASQVLYTSRSNAKKRNLKHNLSKEYIWQLFINQNKRCALSNIELVLINNSGSTASLDRIDNTKGYIEGNVQWVHTNINRMKSDFKQDEFVALCKQVASNF